MQKNTTQLQYKNKHDMLVRGYAKHAILKWPDLGKTLPTIFENIDFLTSSDTLSKTIPKAAPDHSQTHPKTAQVHEKVTPIRPTSAKKNDLRGPGIEPATSRFQARAPPH